MTHQRVSATDFAARSSLANRPRHDSASSGSQFTFGIRVGSSAVAAIRSVNARQHSGDASSSGMSTRDEAEGVGAQAVTGVIDHVAKVVRDRGHTRLVLSAAGDLLPALEERLYGPA